MLARPLLLRLLPRAPPALKTGPRDAARRLSSPHHCTMTGDVFSSQHKYGEQGEVYVRAPPRCPRCPRRR